MKSEEMYKAMTALLNDAKDLYDGVDERMVEVRNELDNISDSSQLQTALKLQNDMTSCTALTMHLQTFIEAMDTLVANYNHEAREAVDKFIYM